MSKLILNARKHSTTTHFGSRSTLYPLKGYIIVALPFLHRFSLTGGGIGGAYEGELIAPAPQTPRPSYLSDPFCTCTVPSGHVSPQSSRA